MNLDLNKFDNKKIFLLVFHGGLVCYLILHNFLMPLIRGLGVGNVVEFHYWFIPQIFLFITFFLSDFDNAKKNKIIDVLIDFSMMTVFLGLAFFINFLGKKKIDLEDFTSFISIISVGFFLLGYFIYFRKLISVPPKSVKGFLISLSLALIFVGLETSHNIPMDSTKKKNQVKVLEEENGFGGCEASEIKISLPHAYPLTREIEIKPCGFEKNIAAVSDHGITLENKTSESYMVRVEVLENEKWKFQRIIKINKGSKTLIDSTILTNPGIYRLKSPSSKELGLLVLLVGKEIQTEKVNYLIDPKSFVIKEE